MARINGNAQANTLEGTAGDDRITGFGGNDTLLGGDGNDRLYGGPGDDVINDGPGDDTLDGGDGYDTYIRAFAAVDAFDIVLGYDLERGFNYVPEDPNTGFEPLLNLEAIIFTGDLTFILTGNGADNLLQSAGGNDTLIGGDGADTLNGSAGRDQLTGGADNDVLIGGKGADVFRFTTLGDVDVVVGFVHGVDRIGLSRDVMAALPGGVNLSPGAFYAADGTVNAHDGNDRILYSRTTGKVYYDSDGDGVAAAIQIAQLGAGASHPANLSASDFLIF